MIVWSCSLALAIAGCDGAENSELVRYRYVERHRDSFVFSVPRADAIVALRAVMRDQGFELDDATLGTSDIRTKPKPGLYEHQFEECVAHVVDLRRKSGFFVRIECMSRDENGTASAFSALRRDDFEWSMIERAEPDRALAIINEANQRADKVKPVERVKRSGD